MLTAEPAAGSKAPQLAARKRVSPGREAWRRFRRHRLAMASAVILGLIIVTVVLGPLFWRVPINDID
ncbi:MAG TPA: ABC transporter permease, partial [Xanthobacteraceae bacterium]